MADDDKKVPVGTTLNSDDINNTTESFRQQGQIGEYVSNIFSNHGKVLEIVNDKINTLNNRLNLSKDNLKNLSDPTSSITNQFGILATSALGASKSFENLTNVDTRSLSTFSDQIGGIIDILKSPGSFSNSAVSNAMKVASAAASAMGADQNKLSQAVRSGAESLGAFVNNLVVSADNGLRMQNALLQMSAATGNFGDVMSAAGQDLNNMNKLLAVQKSMIADANRDTHLGTEVLEKYWSELGQIPEVLQQINVDLPGSAKSVNILSAAIQMAAGSGRQYKDILSDLKVATVEFGLSTSEAFSFSARIGELANKLRAPLEDVRTNLLNTTKAFKNFADQGDSAAKQSSGIADIMNRYGDALKNTGMTAQASVNLVSQMTNSISNLTIAQKAFLSQQSGGPSGLRGAFNIENMLRKGETDKVFEVVKSQMEKQFGGKIATLEDASKSDVSANQLQKQMLMLQQGPLAQFAKTDQDAYRILEAFKGINEGKSTVSDLSKTMASDQINKGQQVQNLSRTSFGDARVTAENVRLTANVLNFETMQKMTTAGVGNTTIDTDAQKAMRARLASPITETNKDTDIGKEAASNINDVQNIAGSLKPTFNSFVDGFKQVIGVSGQKKSDNVQRQELQNDIKTAQTQNKPFIPSAFSSLNENNFGEQQKIVPSEMVRSAVVDKQAKNDEVVAQNPMVHNHQTLSNNSQDFNVKLNVDAICSVCKHNLETSHQAASVRPDYKDK